MKPNNMLKAKKDLLVVITGPTAVGKTALSVELAKEFGTAIISCDSRQFFREMKIGTAIPDADELAAVPHHFIGHLSVNDAYDVSRYETEALALLNSLYKKHKVLIMAGGSGLYINAVCQGFDELPDPDPELRKRLRLTLEKKGIAALGEQLMLLDPVYFKEVDKSNPNRLLRAIEVCLITGKPYSQLRKGQIKERPFRVLKIALNRDRQELFDRIAERTKHMMDQGLLDEVISLLPYRNKNALNTVGYKELFDHLDGNCSLEQAVENIETNTRRYAKRQLTWFRKDSAYHWFKPEQKSKIMALIKSLN